MIKMISETSIEKAKKLIKISKEKPIIVKAQDDNFNRKILEYGKFHILLSPESGGRRNSLRQIDSGLNHVLAKIATKNSISIGINLSEISKLNKEEKARRLAKIRQNIKICRKAKTSFATVNAPDKRNVFSLLISLGASTKQAKDAVN